MTIHQAPTPPRDELDDFMAELDQDLKRAAAKAKAERKAAPQPWNNLPVVAVTWLPAAIVLMVNVQRCRCGCEAQSVEGLFLESTTRNGALKQVRHERGPLPKDFTAKPRQLRERLQHIEMCPACFNAASSSFSPPDDLDAALNEATQLSGGANGNSNG